MHRKFYFLEKKYMTKVKIDQNNDNTLDTTTIKKIKNSLLERKKQILKDLEDIQDKKNPENRIKFPEYGDKMDENVQEIGEYTTNLATDKVLESALRDIDNTLKRIADGTYGICKYCKKEIGRKRLLARPVASACIKCKMQLQSNN